MPKRKRPTPSEASFDELAMSRTSRVLRSLPARVTHQKAETGAQGFSHATAPSHAYTEGAQSLVAPASKAHATFKKESKKSQNASKKVDQRNNPALTSPTGPAIAQKTGISKPSATKGTAGQGNKSELTEIVDAKDKEGSDAHREARSRPPPVNSDYLPLPWQGRLGYACLCSYLRYAKPPVFCSRTTRIASILEHRHPLADPSQPEHPTKNRPDKNQPADQRLGQEFVERLGLANCRDMIKVLRWNDKYGIKFLRLSSEAFPFASHRDYGYKLAPFADKALEDVGRVVTELGHRVTTHPGQFTQLGSPHQSVIDASIRDLEYHDEMLSLLNLPPQQNRDAVMVLHMGGVYGDKSSTLSRFKVNYSRLPQTIKDRLVLENDDVSWHVHDLLPVCEELNIPLVLDFHHHNIIFDASKIREGTYDIVKLFPRIAKTWARKKITQKMHYSEPEPQAVTQRERRKHSPRVAMLPPCPSDMDLMIEAKDKEQAVFELMKIFKLPGHDTINEMIPHVREDVSIDSHKPLTKKGKNNSTKVPATDEQDTFLEKPQGVIATEDIDMGGPDRRVYWPPGMEHWLRPQKRRIVKKAAFTDSTPSTSVDVEDEGSESGADRPKPIGRPRKTKARSNVSFARIRDEHWTQ